MNNLNICMKKDEIELFDKYLQKCSNYFEYGGGGSTVYACGKKNINKIYFVENNQIWVNKIMNSDSCKEKINNNELVLIFHQINDNINKNIMPNDLLKKENQIFKENWINYSKSIIKLNTDEIQKINLVLIDGRFRVGCCLMTISVINDECYIAIHDYYFTGKSCNRFKTYCIVEKYLDKIEETSQLVIFKKKKNINLNELNDDYEKMKYEPL